MMNNTNSDEQIIWKTVGEAIPEAQQALCIPHPSDIPIALMPSALISSPKRIEKTTMVSRYIQVKRLTIAELDYFDLSPTPPVNKHYDLVFGETTNGFVGERFQ